jgi:hypothetical protein
VAAVLSHLVASEAERKTLGTEVLHLYREVNLIYNFSEQLAARLELQGVAELTLAQARQLLAATDGAVLVLGSEGNQGSSGSRPSARPARARPLEPAPDSWRRSWPPGTATSSTTCRRIRGAADEPWASLLCAPLKVGERVTGAIALASATPSATRRPT